MVPVIIQMVPVMKNFQTRKIFFFLNLRRPPLLSDSPELLGCLGRFQSDAWGALAKGFTKRRVESAELQLSPLDRKLGEVAPRGPSSEALAFLFNISNLINV